MYPSDTDRLCQDLRNIAEDLQHVLEDTAHTTGEHAEALRSRARQRLHHIHMRLGEMEGEAAGRLRIAAICTDDYVKRRPWVVIGGAATVAFLLGMLARSRH